MKRYKFSAIDLNSLTKDEFDKEMQIADNQIKNGQYYSADEVEAEFKKEFGLK